MTAPGQMQAAPPAGSASSHDRTVLVSVLVIAFGLAAIVGAYLDWIWWPVYSGIALTIVALPICLIGAFLGAFGRGLVRRFGLVILVIGIGLLAGQNLGPSRAPLLYADGSMSVILDGPIVATASGPASCQNVADGTEISVSGDPNMRLDTPDRPFLMVWFDKGDRWEALRSGPRSNGIALQIAVTSPRVPDDGSTGTIGMGADASSTVELDANATGGVIRFANLVPLSGADYSGEAMDLSGTIEFVC